MGYAVKAIGWLGLLCCTGLDAATDSVCSAASDTAMVQENNGYSMAVQFQPEALQVGQLHSLVVHVCDDAQQPYVGSIDATAIMPAHNHGMNYRPRFNMSAPGQYLGTGFLFHMPGDWQLKVTINPAGERQYFAYDLSL